MIMAYEVSAKIPYWELHSSIRLGDSYICAVTSVLEAIEMAKDRKVPIQFLPLEIQEF